MGNRTPFHDLHLLANAKMVDFAGWQMPLHYGSQLEEHHQVRRAAGLFDVSHMGIVDLSGRDAAKYLRLLLANDIDRIHIGKALYTCMLNENGGVLDDLIVYQLDKDAFRVVINAGRRAQDLAWMKANLNDFSLKLTERNDLVMLAIQGPTVADKCKQIFPKEAAAILALKPFHFLNCGDFFFARTGYTGEDGYEIIFPATQAKSVWEKSLQAGIAPCGLGARDTLRLEAGLNLYGSDMDETVTPFESNLGWTVAMEPKDRNFIGRAALERQQQAGVLSRLVGLILSGPGIIRNHQRVITTHDSEGEVTSGGYSPTLEKSIALARVPQNIGETCFVEIRNKPVPAQVVKPPFVRKGKKFF